MAGLAAAGLAPRAAWAEAPQSGADAIAMHGLPRFSAQTVHQRYVRRDAPRGGRLVIGVLGSFDSLNPFIVRGLAVQQVRGYVVESLLVRGFDEPFSLYAHIACAVETDDARSHVTFTIDPRARFADGAPVTTHDVAHSFALLRDRGRPNHRTFYRKVRAVRVESEHRIHFDLGAADDRELPLILGLMPVLARHVTPVESFERTSFAGLLGSGPYRVGAVRPGDSVTFLRNADWWGNGLPSQRGLWNFDEVRFDFYRDATTHFEAFRKGLFDLRVETDPVRWQTAHDFPAITEGRVLRDSFDTGLPKPMSAYVFNTRRPPFADPRVREAIATLFDFEWTNRALFGGAYRRTFSFFEGSELSARGRPADAAERALLAPFPAAVLPDVMEGRAAPPVTDGTGADRAPLRRALALLRDASYGLRNGTLVAERTGEPLRFEILTTTRDQDRLALVFARQLARAGIEATPRQVDAVQFDRRRNGFEFDMLQASWAQSLSPGNEQAVYFGSAAARQEGSRNLMGLESQAADAMIRALLAARTREAFVSAVRALDRVLISARIVVPLFHVPQQWVARSAALGRPAETSLYGYLPETWWRDPAAGPQADAPQPPLPQAPVRP
jgi:peptide/nickel transport system substrate-binding protein